MTSSFQKRHAALLLFSICLTSCGGGGGSGGGSGAGGGSGTAISGAPSVTTTGSSGSATTSTPGGGTSPSGPVATCVVLPPSSDFHGTSLSGDVAPSYPQCSSGFVMDGSMVTGSGLTASATSDYFYGQSGVEYQVTIAKGAKLATLFDQSYLTGVSPQPALTTSVHTPNGELIAFSYGMLTNNGTLNTYPLHSNDASNNYKKGAAVVYIANDSAHPSTVVNNGQIGDNSVSDKSSPHYDYAQEDAVGVYVQGGTITNNVGAVINGYNAVFTDNAGTLDNYGVIVGTNDGALSGYVINNHVNASISTRDAGFACVHSYSTVNNYGYMLGADYGILADGNGAVINDFGGTVVTGVSNFDGSPVYNGEISSLNRGTELPNGSNDFSTLDAIMLDGTGMTVNLISTQDGGTVYLPHIVGPMEGGFNGSFASATTSGKNTLNLQLNGISKSEAQALATAIAASKRQSAQGTYYSGSFTMSNGFVYQWEDFALVAYTGTPGS